MFTWNKIVLVMFLTTIFLFLSQGHAFSDNCEDNSQCRAEEFCEKEIGECDGIGTCEDKPQFCTQEYDPVCGCDMNTYSNGCMAHMNGVSILRLGECQ